MFCALCINAKGEIYQLGTPADFNRDLIKVDSDENARVAAAAIMALQPGFASFKAEQIKLTLKEQKWECSAQLEKLWSYRVQFDSDGKCIAVSARFIGIPPP
jgi:hypothetical protein